MPNPPIRSAVQPTTTPPTEIITPTNPINPNPVKPNPLRPTLETIITTHLQSALAFASTQPNADPLWTSIRTTASNYLFELWREGTLKGARPEQAYFVQCGRDTMTQLDIDNGRVIVLAGFAPIAPAEFVDIRLTLPTAP